MNIIIPLGGKGDRFFKAGFNISKPLIPIYEKEMIFYVLDHMVFHPDDKVFFIYNTLLDHFDFVNIIKKQYPFIHFIPIIYQTSGVVETILLGLKTICENSSCKKCVLVDCDTFYTDDILSIIREQDKNLVFYVNRENEPPHYSYIQLDDSQKIIDIQEKIKISNSANTGCYVFRDIHLLQKYCQFVLDNNITFKGEPYTSCVIKEIIVSKEEEFYGYELECSHIISLGTPAELTNYLQNSFCFLFDLDGTLVNTDKVYYDVWKEILQKYNIELNEEIFQKYIHGNSDDLVKKNLLPFVVDDLSVWKDSLFIEKISQIFIIDGAFSFIESLYLMGHKCAIVTNCNRRVAEKICDYFHFDTFIDFIIVGGECAKPKPYPDPYLAAIQKYNIASNRAIIFEDSKSGLLSATSANPLCVVGITTNYIEKDLITCGANVVIDHYNGLDINRMIHYENSFFICLKENIRNSLSYMDIKDIEFDDIKLKGGFISNVYSLRIITVEGQTFNCIIKLENVNETPLSIMATSLGLYDRENYFYENISRYVNVKIPKFYGLIKDPEFHTIGILMENLFAPFRILDTQTATRPLVYILNEKMCKTSHFEINIDLNHADIGLSLKVIESITKMHLKFWNKHLEKNFHELKKHNDPLFCPSWKTFITDRWELFKDKWKHMIPSFEKADKIVENFENIQHALSTGHLTLIHGDMKSPNIFYDKANQNEPYFIDWQYICIGKGVQDIIFFLIESFSIDNIRLYYPLFIQYYYIKLIQGGVQNYSYDEYKQDIRNAICHFPFFVAVWFGTTPEDSLIDKNFPFFFIQKLFLMIDLYIE
jgi:HAD superfamily hydrolase (TIGR01509 family)